MDSSGVTEGGDVISCKGDATYSIFCRSTHGWSILQPYNIPKPRCLGPNAPIDEREVLGSQANKITYKPIPTRKGITGTIYSKDQHAQSWACGTPEFFQTELGRVVLH